MTVIVESKRMKVTNGLRSHVESQARKISKLSKRVNTIRVYLETVHKKSNDQLANVVTYVVEIPGKNVIVRKSARDMYQAVASATEGAARQLRKRYEKRRTRKRIGSLVDLPKESLRGTSQA